jgi:hypothetical protein
VGFHDLVLGGCLKSDRNFSCLMCLCVCVVCVCVVYVCVCVCVCVYVSRRYKLGPEALVVLRRGTIIIYVGSTVRGSSIVD